MASNSSSDENTDNGASSLMPSSIDGPVEDPRPMKSSSPAIRESDNVVISTVVEANIEERTTDLESNSNSPLLQTLSKNRQKKLAKRERARQKKADRKAAEKAQRMAQAIAQGRDLDAERRFAEERTLSGDRKRRLDELWDVKRTNAKGRFEICIDLGSRIDKKRTRAVFEEAMREREVASLAQQIRYCYSYNKKSPNPVFASVTGLTLARELPTGASASDFDFPTVRELLERETGFPEWNRRMFDCTEETLEEYYSLADVATTTIETSFENTHGAKQKRIVYLTSDSPNTLEQLEDGTVYVIGGIVDRNRLKRATIDRAECELKVETAKLPLQEYLLANNISMTTTKVLTVNHVFDILLKYRQYGNDWNKAFGQVLPSRKV